MPPREDREVAALPARAVSTLKLPVIAPFDTPESIVQALANRETAVLAAGLLQVEKRCLALVAKAAPRDTDDPILDYLTKYPTVDGVFAAWDTADKSNNSQLSAAVMSALSALIRLVSTDPFASEPELIRRLLSAYGSHLERALNPGRNDVTVAALKLCNVVVGFGSGRFARKLFGCIQWAPKIISRLFRTRLKDNDRNPLLNPDIRTLLVMLVLAFLAANDSRLKAEVIDAKGLLTGLIKGLSEDPEIVINHVLVGLYEDVIVDRSIGLEARRSIFDENSIIEILKLYDVPEEENPEQSARISCHRFLYALTEWLSTQINESQTRSFGPQKVLGTVLRTLKVTEDSEQRELGLHILSSAPILAGAFWARFPSSLDPRLSSRWISSITFATLAVALPVSKHLLVSPTSTTSTTSLPPPPTLVSVLDTILPPTLTKSFYSKALQHENPLVSFLSSIFLLAALQKATKVLETLAESSLRLEEGETGRWRDLALRVREALRLVLPDPQIVVALMQKTAVVAPVISKKKSKSKKEVADVVAAVEVKEEEGGRHLRTNVALRLLWLYHRVVPSLISTLRFDFSKLPQAHAVRTDAEGIRAISSAYALRLAAIHSSALTWSRPGDHFKNTLSPLFQLYRTPSTPSNRNLLLSILGNLLQTPLLFNTSYSTEVDIWLSSLPVDPTESVAVLEFFEKSVQKTLVAPIKSSAVLPGVEDKVAGPKYSPLLATILAGLGAEVEANSAGMMKFVRIFALRFIGQARDMEFVGRLVTDLVSVLGKGKAEKETVKFLKECANLLESEKMLGTEVDEIKEKEMSALLPVKANVFATLSSNRSTLQATISDMPIELVFLHVRSIDIDDSETVAFLQQLVARTSSWLAALQVLLHRYTAAEPDRVALASMIVTLLHGCTVEKIQKQMKLLLTDAAGLQIVFDSAVTEGVAALVGSVLSMDNKADIALAQPFCRAVFLDLAESKAKSKSRGKLSLSNRMLSSSALLPYFDAESTLAFFDNLLSKISVESVTTLDTQLSPLIEATLAHASKFSSTPGFTILWTKHFVLLHRLSTNIEIPAAGLVLASGAQALLPFTLSSDSFDSRSTLAFRNGAEDTAWRQFTPEWTSELLSQATLGPHQSTVLATLIHRSIDTQAKFTSWLDQKAITGEGLDGAEAAVRALLEVAAATKGNVTLPRSLAVRFAERILDTASPVEEDLRRVIQLLCAKSVETAVLVNELLTTRIPLIDRDSFTPPVLRLLSDLAITNPIFIENLNIFVNASFSGLVRRFAEDEEDTPEVLLLVQEINAVATKHCDVLVFKSHLLDPLITAAVTRRLDQYDPIALAATLCRGTTWKTNEVTRLLNNIFASSHFHTRLLTEAPAKKIQSAIVNLIVVLATSSLAAATSSRVLERLMPFYGGTLSVDDVAIITLFQRIEIVGDISISAAFKLWNPSLEQAPVESTRAGSIATVQLGYVRRSWLRACASARTVFPKEHTDITYDPYFLLSYLSHMIAEDDLKPTDWVSILESGVLGLAVASLASSSSSLRALARSTLALTLNKIEPLKLREKDEITLVLTHAKNCFFDQSGEAIPAVSALFLANCIFVIGTPESPMYPAFSKFLLQRPLLDLRDVPMFYILFYSTSEDPVEDHKWLLRFLAESLVRNQDWKIYRRRQTFELLTSLLQANKQDISTRRLVLQFLLRATSLPAAARELLSRNGLLGWLTAQVSSDASERRLLISIISNVVDVLSFDKVTSISDALDALLRNCGTSDVSSAELVTICQVVSKLVANAPPTTPALVTPSHHLNLTRARLLLSFVASRSSVNSEVLSEFYHAVMRLGFVRSESGIEESKEDKDLFSEGIRAGLRIQVPGIKNEIVRSLLE